MWDVTAELGDTDFFPEDSFAKEKYSNTNKKNNDVTQKKMNMVVLKKHVNMYLRYLTEEIVFDILLHTSAEFLNNNAKLVCKAWKAMISKPNFITQHTRLTKPRGLLVEGTSSPGLLAYRVKLLVVEEEKLDYKLHALGLFKNYSLQSSCNGLILHVSRRKRWSTGFDLKVLNLLTKKRITLPSRPSNCDHSTCNSALAFDPCSKKYKVVHARDGASEFEIYTLGDITSEEQPWRSISGPWEDIHQPPPCFSFEWNEPVVIGGIIHWNVSSDEYIVSMDVSSEKFTRTPLPHRYIGASKYDIIDFDGKLSLVHMSSDIQIDVWILKDFVTHDAWFLKHKIRARYTKYTTARSLSSCNKEQRELPVGF